MSPRPAPPEVDRAAAGVAAIAARRARAAIKASVASRERTPLDVAETAWAQPESAEAGLRVRELLSSIPSLGPTRTARILDDLRISDKKRVGGLGVRQRVTFRDFLQARAGGAPARSEPGLVRQRRGLR